MSKEAFMENWALANTVTAYAVIFSGILALVYCRLHPQPLRWVMVYLAVFITGLATVWLHGFNEPFWGRFSDIGTNLLLAWCVQMAALGDFYSRRTRNIVLAVTGAGILAFLIWMLARGADAPREFPVSFGSYGGYTLGEILLISNVFVAVVLLALKRTKMPSHSRPFMGITVIIFTLGLLFSTASNQQVDGILAYHAIWHLVAATGFFALWVFNDVRFKN
jgi:hypothetical protein